MSRDARWVAERMLLTWLAGIGIMVVGDRFDVSTPFLFLVVFMVGIAISSVRDAREG